MTTRKRFDSAPVSELKIQMINDLLQSHPVNELWLKFVNLAGVGNYKQREIAFNEYCIYRDLYMGFKKPVEVPHVQGSHTRLRGGR